MINQSVCAISECGPEVKCIFTHATRLNKTEERKKRRKVESVHGFARIHPFFHSVSR